MAQRRRKVQKKTAPSTSRVPQEALVRALGHPIRVSALTILTEGVASPKQIATELDMPLSNVSYHVRVLDELGLIQIVEEENVRGSVAHFYRAVQREVITHSDWQRLNSKVRSAFSGQVMEALIADAAGSLASGHFDRREDRHLSRTRMVLDEKGWQRVADIQGKALQAILKEEKAAAGRLSRSSSEGIHVVAGMLCIEVPADKVPPAVDE
jgi:DNA-binding transcriptional ArsR family regulator